MNTATSAEVIEKLAREIEQRRLLDLAKSCKDLDEFVQALESMIDNK